MTDAMEDEFDVVAGWTADAVAALGRDHAIPAGCRGSGSPASMQWLGERLGLAAGGSLLDSGAGVGGPAAYAAGQFGVRPVLAEPMVSACRASATLFGLPIVVAAGQALPFVDKSFSAAWSLGVLCTTTDQPAVLAELRRVLAPGGRLGLLVYERQHELPEQPEGNDFPTAQGLLGMLDRAGFGLLDRAELGDFDSAAEDWQRRADRVTDWVAEQHSDDPRWRTAEDQSQIMGRLLSGGHLIGRLVVVGDLGE